MSKQENPYAGIDPDIINDVLLAGAVRTLDLDDLLRPKQRDRGWFDLWWDGRRRAKTTVTGRWTSDPGMWPQWPEELRSWRAVGQNRSHAVFDVSKEDLVPGPNGNKPAFVSVDYENIEARVIAYYDRDGQQLYVDELSKVTPGMVKAMLAKLRSLTSPEEFGALYCGEFTTSSNGNTTQDPGPFFEPRRENRDQLYAGLFPIHMPYRYDFKVSL